MSLAEDRYYFTVAIGRLLAYAESKDYYLVLDEGRVFSKRKAADGKTYTDAVHIASSKHYQGLAQDFVLYDANWKPISTAHPAWTDLGSFWKASHGSATWGGDWAKKDLGHFSFFES